MSVWTIALRCQHEPVAFLFRTVFVQLYDGPLSAEIEQQIVFSPYLRLDKNRSEVLGAYWSRWQWFFCCFFPLFVLFFNLSFLLFCWFFLCFPFSFSFMLFFVGFLLFFLLASASFLWSNSFSASVMIWNLEAFEHVFCTDTTKTEKGKR